MVSAKTKVINPQGMHMRPAQVFVNEMGKFKSDVTIVFNGKNINGKSIMNLIDSCITGEALAKAVELVDAGLGDM